MIKKVAFLVFVLLILFSLNLFADEDLFKTFQLSYVALDCVDISMSLYGVKIGHVEANPLASWYIKKPVLAFVVHGILDFAIIKLSDMLYKENKKLGWFVIIGLNLIKGYVVYRNIRILWG